MAGYHHISQTNPFLLWVAATTDDNFPVLKTWVDPVTASCQNNYIVTIGDVNTHYDRYIPGNTRTDYLGFHARRRRGRCRGSGKNTSTGRDGMDQKSRRYGGGCIGYFGNSAKRSGLASLDTLETGSTGHGTYYMAGLAYWANTNDIRLDKPVRVKTFRLTSMKAGNGSHRMITNTRGTKPRNSQFYLAAKYGGFHDKNKDGNPFKTFAADNQTVVNNNSEWASNGTDPDNYFLASNPAKMINAIQDIFQKQWPAIAAPFRA